MHTELKCAAVEYASYGIRVNGVMPGAMETDGMKQFRELDPENYKKAIDSIPARNIAETDEIAKIVSWLYSNEANLYFRTNACHRWWNHIDIAYRATQITGFACGTMRRILFLFTDGRNIIIMI